MKRWTTWVGGMLAMLLFGSAHGGFWIYTFPYDGATAQGTWGQVQAFSEQKTRQYYAHYQNVSCRWGASEPNPPQPTFAGPWTGTYQHAGNTYSCSGQFSVQYRCHAGMVWDDAHPARCRQGCNAGEFFDYASNSCRANCPAGERWDPALGRCRAACAAGEVWDAALGRCRPSCAPGFVWDEALGSCRADCASGTRYVAATNACAAIVDERPPSSPPPASDRCGVGNPIYPLRGVKRQTFPTGLAAGHLSFALTYDTTAKIPVVSADPSSPWAETAGSLGTLWSHTLERSLLIGHAGHVVHARRGTGHTATFRRTAQGGYDQDREVKDRLTAGLSGFTLTDLAANAIEQYDAAGRLTRITWATGPVLTLRYSDAATPQSVAPRPGLLIAAQDHDGRSLNFRYDPLGRLTAVTDASGTGIGLEHGGSDRLSALVWQDSTRLSFVYENAALPWALTGVIDEMGARRGSYQYDSHGRAIGTQGGAGSNAYVVSYGVPPRLVAAEHFDPARNVVSRTHAWQPAEGISYSTPAGGVVQVSSVAINGRPYLSSQSNPPGSGCQASTMAMAHDGDGNLVSRDDFVGSRSCWAYDTRG